MDIMNFFRGTPATATVASPAQVQAPANGTIDPNGQQGQQQPVDPLAGFTNLWQKPAADPNNPNPAPVGPNFNVKPEDIQKIASGYDFRQAITPELMGKIQGGGAEALTAMLEAMNTMQQVAFTQSALAATKIVETTYNQTQDVLTNSIDKQIKSNQVASTIYKDNPALKNPAVAPMIEMVKHNLMQHNPLASAEEIAALASHYITEVANAFNAPQLQKQQQQLQAGEVDWAARLGTG